MFDKCYEETDKVVNTVDWTRGTVAEEIVNGEIGCSQSRTIEVDEKESGRDGRTVCLKGGLVGLTRGEEIIRVRYRGNGNKKGISNGISEEDEGYNYISIFRCAIGVP